MNYTLESENHLHKLDGVALTGTSSVIDVLAKPLTWWASGLACAEFGWLNPKKHSEEEWVSYIERIKQTFLWLQSYV